LYGAAYRGEYVVGIATDQTNRAHNDNENYCQHHGVLGNVLSFIALPQTAKEIIHDSPLLRTAMALLPSGSGEFTSFLVWIF